MFALAQVKRADELARKLRFFTSEVEKAGLPVGNRLDGSRELELDALEARVCVTARACVLWCVLCCAVGECCVPACARAPPPHLRPPTERIPTHARTHARTPHSSN